jgi:hypothetical protein
MRDDQLLIDDGRLRIEVAGHPFCPLIFAFCPLILWLQNLKQRAEDQ